MAKTSILDLVHISVRRVVQGVGFRPFVYQLATKYNLKGWVCNTSEDVKIEVEGEAAADVSSPEVCSTGEYPREMSVL